MSRNDEAIQEMSSKLQGMHLGNDAEDEKDEEKKLEFHAQMISFFTHKGGVSKTTHVHHLGYILAKKYNFRVLMIDGDPQQNLTQTCCKSAKNDANWRDSVERGTIYTAMKDADCMNHANCIQLNESEITNGGQLWLLPGSLNLAKLEPNIIFAHNVQLFHDIAGGFRHLFISTATHYDIDFCLIDMGPSIGELNKSLFWASDYFIIPCSADSYCKTTINTMQSTLPRWFKEQQRLAAITKHMTMPLNAVSPKLLGIIFGLFQTTGKNKVPIKHSKRWMDIIKKTTKNELVPQLPDDMVHECCNSDYTLSEIPNFLSLMPIAQRSHCPVYDIQAHGGYFNVNEDEDKIPMSNTEIQRHEKRAQYFEKKYSDLAQSIIKMVSGMNSFLDTSLAKKKYYQKFQSLSNVSPLSSSFDDGKNTDDLMDAYSDNILNNKPSGNVSNRDTLLHIINGLAVSNGQKCVFFNSEENIIPQHKSERNGHLHIIEANNNKDKTFVLTLNSLKNKEEKDDDDDDDDGIEEEIFAMQKCIEANKTASHPLLKDIKSKLSRVHNVCESRIQVIGVFVGSFNVEYKISDLKAEEVQKMKGNTEEMQSKMNELFDNYNRLNIHPILFQQTYDISMFDQVGNKTFDKKNTYQVGKDKDGKSEIYTQPIGWTRYGLNVLGKYHDGDTWLHPFKHKNNWHRAFHGTRHARHAMHSGDAPGDTPVDAMSSIYKSGFKVSYKDGRNRTRAKYGNGVYVSPNPEFVEKNYAATISIDTERGPKEFKFMLMVAVKPDSVIRDSKDIWHVFPAKDVRPYGILIKELKS